MTQMMSPAAIVGDQTMRKTVVAPGLGIGGGAFEGQHAFLGGQDRISRNLPSPRCQNF